jgi:hypothetical protein
MPPDSVTSRFLFTVGYGVFAPHGRFLAIKKWEQRRAKEREFLAIPYKFPTTGSWAKMFSKPKSIEVLGRSSRVPGW